MKKHKTASVVREDGSSYLECCIVGDTAWTRIVGLLAHKSLSLNEGFWLEPCTSVHTFFMKFAIDAVFLDRKGRVIAIYDSMMPWRITWIHPFARIVLETSAGLSKQKGLKKGEVLKLCHSS